MAQMKEQNSRKKLNEMEISNLSDAEFNTLVSRMLKELIGNSAIKKDLGRNQSYFEIKKKLQGTNSGVDEAENQINDFENKEENTFNPNSKKKKE